MSGGLKLGSVGHWVAEGMIFDDWNWVSLNRWTLVPSLPRLYEAMT